jgi:hypothetical protein
MILRLRDDRGVFAGKRITGRLAVGTIAFAAGGAPWCKGHKRDRPGIELPGFQVNAFPNRGHPFFSIQQ